jgi:putative membrane protein
LSHVPRFYSNSHRLDSLIGFGADVATLTREAWPSILRMGAGIDETAIDEKLMSPGENSWKGGPDAVSSTSRPIDDPRVYLASERTFLAWVRTSISLMGFGFVIARFALWTREFGAAGKVTRIAVNPGISTWLGVGMVCVGVAVVAIAAQRHLGYIRDLERGVPNPPLHVKTSMILAGVLALVGLLLAIHIFFI